MTQDTLPVRRWVMFLLALAAAALFARSVGGLE